MHDHGGGGAHDGAWVNMLPLWLQFLFVVALAGFTGWALVETFAVRGVGRLVAALHALAGVGMIDMFAPWVGDTGRATFWQIAFAAAAGVALLGLLVAAVRRRDFVALWALTLLDAAAMAYMFLLFDGGWSPLTYALVGIYAALTVGWVHGALDASHRVMCGTPRLLRINRWAQAAMAAAMAWMFLVMAPQTGGFFGRAFTVGLTEDTWWALALIALILRALADPALVRRLAPAGQPSNSR